MSIDKSSGNIAPPASGVTQADIDGRHGLFFALAAFGIWALNPLFFKLLGHINPVEIVANRAIWSVPVGLGIVILLGRTSDIAKVFRTPALLGKVLITGLLITVNWGLFVWAIAVGLTLEASLAYYINPLFNVVLGFVLLGERLTRPQTVAVGLAFIGVLIQAIDGGVFPWVAIVLAVSFSTYGYLRKTMPVGPSQGFVAETILLLPLAFGIIIWFYSQGTLKLGSSGYDTFLLVASGPATAIPLLLFAAAARRLRYSTIGIVQFITPSGMFLTAVFIFGEPISVWKLAGFVFIWLALIVYTFDAIRRDKTKPKTR